MKIKLSILFLLLVFTVVFSGCVNSGIESVAMGLPEVQAFLAEHPGAEFRTALWEQDVVEEHLDLIIAECGIQMKAVSYWVVDFFEDKVHVSIYIRQSDNQVMCMLTKGSNLITAGDPQNIVVTSENNEPKTNNEILYCGVENSCENGLECWNIDSKNQCVKASPDLWYCEGKGEAVVSGIYPHTLTCGKNDEVPQDTMSEVSSDIKINVIQLTNYDQIVHRTPEQASISADGGKFAFFKFVKYQDGAEENIRNAVFVGNTSSLNDSKMVFESGTIVSRTTPAYTYYYFANTGGSTALSEDGKYVYFMSADSIRGAYGTDSPIHLARVNTGTSEFNAIDFPVLPGYEETRLANFQISGNKIYYVAQLVKEDQDSRTWTDTGIFSMNLDGSNKELLAKTIGGEYPHIYSSNMSYDSLTDKLYFEGQTNPNIDGIYYLENNGFKKVDLSEELGDNGLVGVYNNEIILSRSGPDFSYNVLSKEVTEFDFDLYPRYFMTNNGNVVYGKVSFSIYNPLSEETTVIIGNTKEQNSDYRDLKFRLVNQIIPYNGETANSDGKTILVQEEKTGFGNYYLIKVNGQN